MTPGTLMLFNGPQLDAPRDADRRRRAPARRAARLRHAARDRFERTAQAVRYATAGTVGSRRREIEIGVSSAVRRGFAGGVRMPRTSTPCSVVATVRSARRGQRRWRHRRPGHIAVRRRRPPEPAGRCRSRCSSTRRRSRVSATAPLTWGAAQAGVAAGVMDAGIRDKQGETLPDHRGVGRSRRRRRRGRVREQSCGNARGDRDGSSRRPEPLRPRRPRRPPEPLLPPVILTRGPNDPKLRGIRTLSDRITRFFGVRIVGVGRRMGGRRRVGPSPSSRERTIR